MLPDRSILIGQKLVENAKIQTFKCDILSNFQTMWEHRDVIFMLQIHPKSGNNNFRQSNRHRNRPPSGKGDDDCTFDWLLIPGARGNLTRFGMYLT